VAQLQDFRLDLIDTFLTSSKVAMIILVSFFVCYRWANMLNDGSYGFWLSTGVNRRKFFIRTGIKLTFTFVLAQYLGITMILYQNSIQLPILLIIQLALGIISNVIFILILAVFLSNWLRNPEFASITYLTIMGFNIGFNSSSKSPLAMIFQSDLAYRTDNAIIAFIISLIISSILLIITLRLHVSQDIDI